MLIDALLLLTVLSNWRIFMVFSICALSSSREKISWSSKIGKYHGINHEKRGKDKMDCFQNKIVNFKIVKPNGYQGISMDWNAKTHFFNWVARQRADDCPVFFGFCFQISWIWCKIWCKIAVVVHLFVQTRKSIWIDLMWSHLYLFDVDCCIWLSL